MGENIYLCQRCGDIYRPSPDKPLDADKNPECPKCGNSQVRRLPSWVPTGADLEHFPNEWEYECQDCHKRFMRPVPASPSQEGTTTCPACHNNHIHRVTQMGLEPLYCG
jgi:DNA-directed RNA polymerase subunit RPC12/RpoP